MNKYIFILFSIILNVLTLNAQVKMEVDAPHIIDMSEEYFQVKFIVNDAEVSHFTPPSLSDFEFLSGPFSSVRSSTSFVNGKSHHESSKTFTYTLAPKKKGTFTIQEATAVVKGKTIHSTPHTIKVTGDGRNRSNSSAPAVSNHQQPNINKVSNQDLFITVAANRKKIYEQEPVLLTYKFYARPDVMLSQIGIQKKPDFKGMLSQDIPVKNIQMNIEDISGISYRTGVIQKYLIFPQNHGNIVVPGVTFDCDIMQRDLSIDPFEAFFNGGGTISKTVQRKVENIDLEILPLPQPQPTGFSGGVGEFSIKGGFVTHDFKTNDVATYRITIEGTGNLKLITTPKLELSDDFDVYTPKVTEHTSVNENGISGEIIYDYTFVPRKVGSYVLSPVHLVYFDPSSESYKMVSTSSEPMNVEKGERTNEEYQRTQNLQQKDIKDIHNSVGTTKSIQNVFWWSDLKYWLIYVVVIALSFVVFHLLQKYKDANVDITSRNSKKAGKMATRRMKVAKKFMMNNNRAEFYGEVSHALYDYISHKYNISLAELNRSKIEFELLDRGITEDIVHSFMHLIDECDFAQYAPSNQVMDMEEMYNGAIKSIIEIEKLKKGFKS